MKLRPKQQAFADEYIITGNAYKSAIAAGYSENYAKGNIVKLLDNVSVKSYIDKRMQELKSERVADQQEILEFLTSIMRGEQQEEVLRGIGEGAQTIDDIDVGAKDRIKAAEMLGRRYAMWTDKQEVNGNVNVTIIDDLDDGDED